MPTRTNFHNSIKYGIIPLVALLVVGSHFYNRQKGLSAWKGGGFGMYSTYNPSQAQLYINGTPYKVESNAESAGNYYLGNYLNFPNEHNLEKIIKTFDTVQDTLLIQIWQPSVDSKSSTYSRKLVHEFTYIKHN